MNFLKSSIEENLRQNPGSLLREVCLGLDSFLEYYSILQIQNIQDFLVNFEKYSFISIRGVSGVGKNLFLKIIKNTINPHINVYEFDCSSVTELDDIFFTFYKFMLQVPCQKDVFKNIKSNFKPQSIDEQILNYLKKTTDTTLLIFNNIDNLIDESGNFKAENLKSFFEFLSIIKGVKVIATTSINLHSVLSFPEKSMYDIKLYGLEQNEIKDFLGIFKVDASSSLYKEIFDQTNGLIFSLKLLVVAEKILGLPISVILKERAGTNFSLNEFLSRKLMAKLSGNEKKLLMYLSIFRHEINLNILKTIDYFDNILGIIERLRDFLFLEEEGKFYLREFLRSMIYSTLSDREKQKLHEVIANFYAAQIPLKPNERIIELSRTTLYSEKFYHHNISSKLLKNFELQNSKKLENNAKDNMNYNSTEIKYIASTKYLPDLNIKYEDKIETPIEVKDNKPKLDSNGFPYLTDEEKELLVSEELAVNDEDFSSEGIVSPDGYETNYDIEFDENVELSVDAYFEETELQKAEKLLKKGKDLCKEGDSLEAINYLKNAMAIFQDSDVELFDKTKLILAKAQIECFQNKEAVENLKNIIDFSSDISLKIEAYIELSIIDEYSNNFNVALDKLLIAMELATSLKDATYIAKIFFRIALIYDYLNDHENALYYYLLCVTDVNEVDDKTILASAFSNIAGIYYDKKEFSKAIDYYKKSLIEDEYLKNYEGQAKTLSYLGDIFVENNKFENAIKIFIKQIQISKKTEDKYLIASSYLALGDTFFSIQDYKNALKAYFLSKKNIDSTISTDSKNKIERRFEMIVDEIGESAYNFLVKELRKQ